MKNNSMEYGADIKCQLMLHYMGFTEAIIDADQAQTGMLFFNCSTISWQISRDSHKTFSE